MPTCTVEMFRWDCESRVLFRPLSRAAALYCGISPVPTEGAPPDLPPGMLLFASPGRRADALGVVQRLDTDERGKADVLNMMVAADWLRDQGWEVIPLGWCRTVFDRVYGVTAV